jgi:hypothetical protein
VIRELKKEDSEPEETLNTFAIDPIHGIQTPTADSTMLE